MSVRIDVGPYRLESYGAGWTIGEPRAVKSGETIGEEYLAAQTFYGSLRSALEALQDRWVRESSAQSFDELRTELKAFRAELTGLFAIEVREPDRDRHRRRVPA